MWLNTPFIPAGTLSATIKRREVLLQMRYYGKETYICPAQLHRNDLLTVPRFFSSAPRRGESIGGPSRRRHRYSVTSAMRAT
jgi:hypothetical protein